MGKQLPPEPPKRLDGGCGCPRVQHRHGVPSTYLIHRCRCRPCRDAANAYRRARYRKKAYGQPITLPVAPVRDHIVGLRHSGMSLARIARAADVGLSTVGALVYEDRQRMSPDLAQRILAVEAVATRVPVLGVRRRLEALACLGWSVRAVAAAAGLPVDSLGQQLRKRRTVSVERFRLVVAVYDALWNQSAPDSPAARRTRIRAEREGWAPPMAWDDNTIDVPAARPRGRATRQRTADIDAQQAFGEEGP